ncbi:hypothetical protein [Denitromonas sp.]|uniref:hypothetical protein n=1 Tax=Denitromonas sp. TaxID=2734609 RepID=UPI002FDE23B3
MNDDRLRTIARTTLLRAGEPTTLDTLLHRHRRQVSELLLKYADSSRHDIRLTTWMRASPRGLELEVGYLATDQSMLAFDDNAAQPISEALDEQQINASQSTAMRHALIANAIVSGDLNSLDQRDVRYVKRKGGKRVEVSFEGGDQLHLIPALCDNTRGERMAFTATVMHIGQSSIRLARIKEISSDTKNRLFPRGRRSTRYFDLDLGAVDELTRKQCRAEALDSLEPDDSGQRPEFRFHAVPIRSISTGELLHLTLDR